MGTSIFNPDDMQRAKLAQLTAQQPVPEMALPTTPEKMPDLSLAFPQAQAPNLVAPRGTVTGDQEERSRRLMSGPGESQIYKKVTESGFGQAHPLAAKILGGLGQGLATAGDIGLSAVAPTLAMNIPGTEYHHQLGINKLNKQIGDEESESKNEAETRNLDLQPQLSLAKQGLAEEKQNETEQHHQDQVESQLRAHGYKTGDDGQIQPLSYEEMSPQQQAVTDLKGSQEELAEANKELKKAQADPNGPQYRLAMARVQGAQQAREIAIRRLALSESTAAARYRGTDTEGNALPGAMLTDEGQPVGSAFSSNVRPTGSERNKGDMAISAREQLSDIKSIVQKHPNLFGPGYGQSSAFRQWIGSEDQDAQRFLAARTIAADHLAGTFGGRSEAALDALDKAIGQFKDNPRAMEAGLDQLLKANTIFEQKGHVHSVGSTGQGGGTVKLKAPDGTVSEVPASQKDHYIKLGAKEVK